MGWAVWSDMVDEGEMLFVNFVTVEEADGLELGSGRISLICTGERIALIPFA